MILFAKVMTAALLLGAAVKVLALAARENESRGWTAIDLLIYVTLGIWGVAAWAADAQF